MKVFTMLLLGFLTTVNVWGQTTLPITPASPYFYAYNDGQDTLFLSKPEFGGFMTAYYRVWDTLQIDGQGAKEVLFYRTFSGSIGDHGGTFDITERLEITQYEVWNLDTKTQLFQARSHYEYSYDRARIRFPRESGHHLYGYTFTLNPDGQIILSDPIESIDATPDHQPGTYAYRDGAYRKID